MTTAMAGRFVIVWHRVFDPASANDETIPRIARHTGFSGEFARRNCGPSKALQACRSRRISAESTKKPSPTLSGIMPKAAAIQASDSTRAMSAKVSV